MGEEEILGFRVGKRNNLLRLGLDPYPARSPLGLRSRQQKAIQQIKAHAESRIPDGDESELIARYPGGRGVTYRAAGRVRAIRNQGGTIFCDIADGTGKIQLYLRRDWPKLKFLAWARQDSLLLPTPRWLNKPGDPVSILVARSHEALEFFEDHVDLGDIVEARGNVFRTRRGELTLRANDLALLTKTLRPPPEKWHGVHDVEIRYRQRYLDLMSSAEVRETFVTRSKIISCIRRFLDARGYLEVETPVLQSSAGGAAARPFVTHHNTLDRDFYLRISLELHLKRLVVGGFDRVYELGRIFRNEGASTKYNPEFTMLELYEAYADYNRIMELVEEIVTTIATEVIGSMQVPHGETIIDLTPPWPRIPIRQAIIDRCGIDFEAITDDAALRRAAAESGVRVADWWGRGKTIDELFTLHVEPHLIQPTFIVDYPVELSPLAKRKPGDPHLVERFEFFICGREGGNAYTELNDPIDQRERMLAQAGLKAAGDEEAELADEDFLVALEHGMPPTGGLGIGIDRLVMALTGQHSIREVILFPALREREGK